MEADGPSIVGRRRVLGNDGDRLPIERARRGCIWKVTKHLRGATQNLPTIMFLPCLQSFRPGLPRPEETTAMRDHPGFAPPCPPGRPSGRSRVEEPTPPARLRLTSVPPSGGAVAEKTNSVPIPDDF
jgi:hypothetical protein